MKGLIDLPITLGIGDNVVTKEVKFLIVNQPSVYNTIINRPLIKKTSMVTAVYCLTIKFPTPIGVGYVKANLTTARQCHIQSLRIDRKTIGELAGTPTELAMGGDVLAIDQRPGSDITLDSLDLKD